MGSGCTCRYSRPSGGKSAPRSQRRVEIRDDRPSTRWRWRGREGFPRVAAGASGRRFIVMGGVASFEADLTGAPRGRWGDVVISTNAHGVALRRPDYALAMTSGIVGTTTRRWGRGCVAHRRADHLAVRLCRHSAGALPQNPRFVLSGMIAAWAAWAMVRRWSSWPVRCLRWRCGLRGRGAQDRARRAWPVRVVGRASPWPAFDPPETLRQVHAAQRDRRLERP